MNAKTLTVSALITDARLLKGTHCIEYVLTPTPGCATPAEAAYWIRQIACCRLRQDPTEPPLLMERHRSFGAKTTDPWPAWRAFLGSGVGAHGFYGSCALHLEALLAPARLVALADNDRVPPEEPAWDPYRHRQYPDRLASERAAFAEACR